MEEERKIYSILGVLCLLVIIIFGYNSYENEDKKRANDLPDLKPTKELEELIPALNKDFYKLDLSFSKFARVKTATLPTYIIVVTTKDTVTFPFQKEKYYFSDNSFATKKLDNLLGLIDSTKVKNRKMLDFLKDDELEITINTGLVDVTYRVSLGAIIKELGVFFMNMYDFHFKKLRIYVKGYADYSKNPWYGIKEEKYGIPDTLMVHPVVKVTSNQMLIYKDILEQRIAKTDTFYNRDLPNLRAAYIKNIIEEIITDYVAQKGLYRDVSVELLDGSEVGKDEDSTQRKAEIIIQVFDK